MKSLPLIFLLFGCLHCFAADGTNVIVATDWSEPVESNHHYLRGRLVIGAGGEPAYGGPKTDNLTMMFVELKNSEEACCGSDKLFFDVMGLKCVLADTNGKPAPEPKWGGGGGRGPLGPSWIVLPYNSTIRLFVNSGTTSPLTICKGGEPRRYWEIPSTDTNVYYLSATLNISTATNATLIATPHQAANPHEYAEWQGTLVFPKVKISASQFAK